MVLPSSEVPRYRPAKPLPAGMSQQLAIYLDEKLYVDALTLVSDVIVAGASQPENLKCPLPTYIPQPLHLEIISSLLIHPRYTSQAPKKERIDLPSYTINALRSILSVVGPVNASFKEVFSFTATLTRRELEGRKGSRRAASSDQDSEPDDTIKGILGNEGRLMNNAKDFWHIVGWVFNCSVIHHHRWKYWKIWLDFILDVLDADWEARENENDSTIRESMLAGYLTGTSGRSAAVRRVVASVFTDGDENDLKSYPEVYPEETTAYKPKGKSVTHRMSKFRQGIEDDMADEDDMDFDFDSLAEDEITSDETLDLEDNSAASDDWLGGSESIVLRQRMIKQLSRAAFYLPKQFVNCKEAYSLIADYVTRLPITAFSQFMSSSGSHNLGSEVYVSLLQVILIRYLPSSSPSPASISRDVARNDAMDQEILEKCYLPFAASTSSVENNAKYSLLIENIIRLFLTTNADLLVSTPDLEAAVEKGILAREKKTKSKIKGAKTALQKEDEIQRLWLRSSGQRLRTLVRFVRKKR